MLLYSVFKIFSSLIWNFKAFQNMSLVQRWINQMETLDKGECRPPKSCFLILFYLYNFTANLNKMEKCNVPISLKKNV